MSEFYVDLLNGSDAAAGSQSNPFKTFKPINDAAAWGGNSVLVKRGTYGLVNSANRANIAAPAGCLLTSYGDAAAPLPVISGGGVAFNPVWVKSGAGIIVEQVHVTLSAGDGLIISPTGGATLDDVRVRDCLATMNNQSNLWGADGLKVGLSQVDGGETTNVRIDRVVVRDNRGHGIKLRGRVTGAVIRDCVALRNGLGSPSHALGTAGNFLQLDGSGWTNVGAAGGSPIWEHPAEPSGSYLSVFTSWFGVWLLGAGPTYYRLTPSATPSAPLPGECGIGANNTVRINIGAILPSALTSAFCVYARPKEIHFERCVGGYTVDSNGLEGDGIYFDNGSVNCYSHNCGSIGNQGHGFYLNDATDCGHYGGYAKANMKGGAAVTRSSGTNMHGNTLVCLPGTAGIDYVTGNSGAAARMNQIVGAGVGIRTNDLATNAVTEDQNAFVSCGSRLQSVSGPGGRSFDLIALSSKAPCQVAWLSERKASEAEAII